MKENKHSRYLFRFASLLSVSFHISTIVLCIYCLVTRANANMIALYIAVGVADIGIPYSIYSIIMGRQAVKEFKSRYPITIQLMIINTIAIIPYLIGLKFIYPSIIVCSLVFIANLPFILEIRTNEKYYYGIELAKKAQLDQIQSIKTSEKVIDENMQTEENMAAFGKVAAPLTKEQKIIQQLKEINILFEAGMMEEKEYSILKDKIKAS